MTIEATLERIAVALERLSGLTVMNDTPPAGVGGYMPPPVGVPIPLADAPAEVPQAMAALPPDPPKRRGRPPKATEVTAPPPAAEPPVSEEAPAAEQEEPEREVTVEMLRSVLMEFGSLASTEEGFKLMLTYSGARRISDIPPERRVVVYQAAQDAIRAARRVKENTKA